jgi:hypothetical protein
VPTFQDPAADAAEAQQALRGLAHATRTINDPREIYAVLTLTELGIDLIRPTRSKEKPRPGQEFL